MTADPRIHSALERALTAENAQLRKQLAAAKLEASAKDHALEHSERRYRGLYDAIDLGFCIVEVRCDDRFQPTDYRFLEVNGAFERETGLKDPTGRWMRNVVPDHEQYWFDQYAAIARTGQPARFEYTAHAVGHRTFDVSAYRIGPPEEHQVAILFSDITARKRDEIRRAALLELNDRLAEPDDVAGLTDVACGILGRALAVNHVGYGLVDADAETVTIEKDWIAGGAASLAGTLSFGDLGSYVDDLQRDRTVVVSDVRTDPRTQASAATLEKRSARAFVNTPIFERGRFVALHYVSTNAVRAWTDDDLTFIREVAARTRAATERRRAEQDLRDLASALERQVTERTLDRNRLWLLSGDLMLMADLDGVITTVNPAWTEILGWRADELLGVALFEFIHPDDLDDTVQGARAIAVENLTLTRFENRYRRKDGAYRWISWMAGPAKDAIVAVGRDITEDKDKAAALAHTEQALLQSQKMEAVGQLTGGLAHDFNNLLTGISGSLELLQIRIDQGRTDDLNRYVSAAQGSAKRAAALTHRLLAFSRRQTLDPKPTDVNQLIQGMEELVQRTVGPEISLATVTAKLLWNTLVDPGQLENALLNLCINARDAMPHGGSITIETENLCLDEAMARERDMAAGPYVLLRVSDTGAGMSPEVMAKAFEPFFTTKPTGMGTGLGLSMIYGFSRQSGGQVRIASEIGCGTQVCLYLPRHTNGVENSEQILATTDPPHAEQGETVLVVDDEPTIRMLVTEVLENLGYTAIEARDGATGLRILQSDVPIDLLVTDVGLPGGTNGRQMADAARVVRPDLQVLFITGYAEAAVLSHGDLDPGMHVLTKPFAMETLANRIKSLLSDH